jgi:hypothetical protein
MAVFEFLRHLIPYFLHAFLFHNHGFIPINRPKHQNTPPINRTRRLPREFPPGLFHGELFLQGLSKLFGLLQRRFRQQLRKVVFALLSLPLFPFQLLLSYFLADLLQIWIAFHHAIAFRQQVANGQTDNWQKGIVSALFAAFRTIQLDHGAVIHRVRRLVDTQHASVTQDMGTHAALHGELRFVLGRGIPREVVVTDGALMSHGAVVVGDFVEPV